jgi:hypothetical protein
MPRVKQSQLARARGGNEMSQSVAARMTRNKMRADCNTVRAMLTEPKRPRRGALGRDVLAPGRGRGKLSGIDLNFKKSRASRDTWAEIFYSPRPPGFSQVATPCSTRLNQTTYLPRNACRPAGAVNARPYKYGADWEAYRIATSNLGKLTRRGMRQVDAKCWRANSSDWLPTGQAAEDPPRVE